MTVKTAPKKPNGQQKIFGQTIVKMAIKKAKWPTERISAKQL